MPQNNIYCPVNSCPNNCASTCTLGSNIPMFYAPSGEFGSTGFNPSGVLGLKNSMQAEGAVPVTPTFTNWQCCPRVTKNKM